MTVPVDLKADPIELTAALVDVHSVSGAEAELAALVEHALTEQAPWLELTRSGNAVLARTNLDRQRRIVFAGHLDTVPVNGNLPHEFTGSGAELLLHGCGSTDMKGGDAVLLHLAATVAEPVHDLTFVFYDCEEVDAARNGLGRIERELPGWLSGALAVVCEPTNAVVEAGCQGTLRAEIRTRGERAHTARAWMGHNAIHDVGEALRRLTAYQPRTVPIDGCEYREGMQAVRIEGGVAGNVVPDECVLTVNHRFAPDTSTDQAVQRIHELFDGFDVSIVDLSGGALPGLAEPAAAELVAVSGGDPVAKLGWTDVARFAALGMPAVNFGPGDPAIAHTRGEHVRTAQISRCAEVLRRFVAGEPG